MIEKTYSTATLRNSAFSRSQWGSSEWKVLGWRLADICANHVGIGTKSSKSAHPSQLPSLKYQTQWVGATSAHQCPSHDPVHVGRAKSHAYSSQLAEGTAIISCPSSISKRGFRRFCSNNDSVLPWVLRLRNFHFFFSCVSHRRRSIYILYDS